MGIPQLTAIDIKSASAINAVALIYTNSESIPAALEALGAPQNGVTAHTLSKLPIVLVGGKSIHLAGTGSLFGEMDDIRKYSVAGSKAIRSVKDMGASKVALVFADQPTPPAALKIAKDEYAHFAEVALFGILQELYEPLQTREWAESKGTQCEPIQEIGVFVPGMDTDKTEAMLKIVAAIERGKRLARDVTGADPERGTPKNWYVSPLALGN